MMAPVRVARSIIAAGDQILLRVVEKIGEDEPALGVGVDDLDGLAGHRGDDVAGTLRIGIRHVLDEADNADDIGLGLPLRQRGDGAGDGSGAAHVALHVLHAAGRLDGDAAGVEDDALADEDKRLGFRVGAGPAHDDDARRPGRALRNADERAHLEAANRPLVEHLHRDAVLGELLEAVGELDGAEDIGRLVDEIAGEIDAFGDGRPGRPGAANLGRIIDRHGNGNRLLGPIAARRCWTAVLYLSKR